MPHRRRRPRAAPTRRARSLLRRPSLGEPARSSGTLADATMAKRRRRQRTAPVRETPTAVREPPSRRPLPRDDRPAALPWWSIVLLLALVVATYAPTFRGGFVWDDVDHVVDNER